MNEQDLAKPAPTDDAADGITQLRFQLNSALLLVVLLAASNVFHLYRITSNAGKDLKSVPPQLVEAARNYETTGLPRLQAFIEQLKEYGKTHPDFQPVLVKHGLVTATAPAAPAPATAAPKTAAPATAPKK